MPSKSYTEHGIKISVDRGSARQAQRSMREAFSVKYLQEFQKSLRDMAKEFSRMGQQHTQFSKGNADEIKELTRTVDELRESYKAMHDERMASSKAEREERRKAADDARKQRNEQREARQAVLEDRLQKRRSFVGGFAQGIGIADYLPAERGMGQRIAGAAIGRGIRGVAGTATAPFRNPGLTGLQNMISGIPVVGGMLGGAFSGAYGMYGRAAGVDMAKLENLYLYGGDPLSQGNKIQAGQDQIGRQMQADIESARSKLRRARQRKIITLNDYNEAMGSLGLTQTEREKSFKPIAGPRDELGSVTVAPQIDAIGEIISPEEKRQALRSRYMRQIRSANAAEKRAAEALRGILEGVEAKQSRLRTRMLNNAISPTSDASQIMAPGFGASFGLSPEAVQNFIGTYLGAQGETIGRQGMASQIRRSIAMKNVFGVGPQLTGAFARQSVAGTRGDTTSLERIMVSAVRQGFDGAMGQEYLQELVQQGRRAEQSGIKLNQGDFARQTATLTQGMGMNRVQALRVAGGLRQATMDLGARGVQSPQDLLMLRAAGFDPAGGRLSYLRAKEKIEGGLDSKGLMSLFDMVTKGAGAIRGMNEEETGLLQRAAIKNFFGAVGIPLSKGLAQTFLEAGRSGDMEQMDKFRRAIDPLSRPGVERDVATAALARTGRGAGLAVVQARQAAQQVEIGRTMAETFSKLNDISITMSRSISRFNGSINKVVGAVDKFANKLDNLASGKLNPTDVVRSIFVGE